MGIGGTTAAIVGQLLRQLSHTTQVICITHLPQVAAMGHQQFSVHKTQQKDRTQSDITLLAETDRIEEIARMLGGLNITKQTRAHATEMLNQARHAEEPATA